MSVELGCITARSACFSGTDGRDHRRPGARRGAAASAPGSWSRRWWRAARCCGRGPSARARAELGLGSGRTAVQLAGREAGPMAEAARWCEGQGARIIDLNFGCPAKKVTNGLSGSALMRDPDHALRLVEAVVGAVDGAGDAEDAARLGRALGERAGDRRAGRGSGRADDHRARADPVPVLWGARRLGGDRGGQAGGRDPGDRQWRHRRDRRGAAGACAVRGRRGDDRAGRAWAAMGARAGRGRARRAAAGAGAGRRGARRSRRRALRGDARLLWARPRGAGRAQASRLVPRRDRRRRGLARPAGTARRPGCGAARAACRARRRAGIRQPNASVKRRF